MSALWPLVAFGIGGIAVSPLAVRAAIQWSKWRFDKTQLQQQADIVFERERIRNRQLAMQHIAPDANGRGGWLTVVQNDGTEHIVNLDTRSVFNQWAIHRIDPLAERLDRMERLLLAARGNGGANSDLLEMPDMSPQLPEYIAADQVMNPAPTYRQLVLGQTVNDAGHIETVTADMADLVHIAVGGSSGWGKSVFLRWLVYQLIKSVDPVQLALIDLEGATLAPFATSDRVMWPVADTETDAMAIMRELADELDRRKALFANYTGADSLYTYNLEADEPLVPLIAIFDEATALLENKDIEGNLRTLSLRARKYGLWLILAGQDWKHNTLDTAIRNQLGSRVQFRAMSRSQSNVLLGRGGAEEIDVKGRAIMILPGREAVTVQSPMIRHSDIRRLAGNGPQYEMPELPDDDPPLFSDDALLDAWDRLPGQGRKQNKSELCKALGGQPVGGFFYKVDEAARRLGIWE